MTHDTRRRYRASYITPIANLPSILQYGLLSYHRARKLLHRSVAMPEIQEKRTKKAVPGARPLHDYVNLYFHARNPMLYKLRTKHQTLCVLRVSAAVLDLQHVVITDGNAASQYTAFWPSPNGLLFLNRDEVYAAWWTGENDIEKYKKTRKKSAEVLVPDAIPADNILGAYVSCEKAKTALMGLGFTLPIAIDTNMFFV